jgi:uncharacterized membrane protein YoaK (UPF0700 family)
LKSYDRGARSFAYCLAGVAGYVDAVGYLLTGGYFVSFMSGNSTRAAVSLADRSDAAILGLALIASFVVGVTAGASVGRFAKERRAQAILCFVSVLLTAAAACMTLERPLLATALLAVAMGAENTVFAEGGEVRIGLTYMTGALVRLGKALAGALHGGERMGWAPYLILWLGLMAGAFLGAAAFSSLGVFALWLAAGGMAAMTLLSPAVRLSARAAENLS